LGQRPLEVLAGIVIGGIDLQRRGEGRRRFFHLLLTGQDNPQIVEGLGPRGI
jgi:hypothetical protein